MIIPDVRGLYRFYAELAERFAEAGHAAIAFDPFGRTAGVGERDAEFDYMPHVKQTTIEGVQADVAACTAALRERAGVQHAVVVGFCFGGAQAFHASTRDDIGLDAVVGFYGRVVAAADGPLAGVIPAAIDAVPDMKLPILGLFGGDDAGHPGGDGRRSSRRRWTRAAPTTRSSCTPARRTRSSTASTTSSPTPATTRGAASWTSSPAWGRAVAG